MARRRTVPSRVSDMIKCTTNGCIGYAELQECNPKEGGGAICNYKCNRCELIIQKTYKI